MHASHDVPEARACMTRQQQRPRQEELVLTVALSILVYCCWGKRNSRSQKVRNKTQQIRISYDDEYCTDVDDDDDPTVADVDNDDDCTAADYDKDYTVTADDRTVADVDNDDECTAADYDEDYTVAADDRTVDDVDYDDDCTAADYDEDYTVAADDDQELAADAD
ncbi:serine-aspartate repeat-containing protein I-like [Homarus americanus]|uniref:serine-aspartate repeat-containing protein I-like n=1 Tax=Homarus americanus TaxID=6706 RepID=UPI001C45563D|nr:serine-aspartate repeat-containing protein I-like [Homarus americanus]